MLKVKIILKCSDFYFGLVKPQSNNMSKCEINKPSPMHKNIKIGPRAWSTLDNPDQVLLAVKDDCYISSKRLYLPRGWIEFQFEAILKVNYPNNIIFKELRLYYD